MSSLRIVAAVLSISTATPSVALDLAEAYRLALETDPAYQAAAARLEADRAGIGVARGRLLPQVNANGSIRRMWIKQQTRNVSLPTSQTDSWNWSVNLSQPLLRLPTWYAYQQAKAVAAGSRLRLTDARGDLLARLARAYFQALDVAAQKRVAEREAERRRVVWRQAKAAFTHGEGSRTDVEEAKARLDEAEAETVRWRGELEIARQQLALLIGRPVTVSALADLANRHAVARTLTERSVDDWVAEAETRNATLRALRADVEAARRKLQQAWGKHLPTLDFIAGYRQSSSDSEITVGRTFKTGTIGLQASLPIFSGGSDTAAVRQAKAQWREACLRLDEQRRHLRQRVLDAYARVRTGMSEVQARNQALRSARQALTATRKGVRAGTRNTVDVLDAAQKVSEAEADQADAVYRLLQAAVELLVAAGRTPEEILRLITEAKAPAPANATRDG